MASFLDQYEIANNPDFLKRVRQASIKAAIDVMAELENTPNHANRIAFANKVLIEPERYGNVLAFGVLTNAMISLASEDNDIQFTINSLFDAYAGK